MIPMVGVSGVSGSGKTTLIEKLIPELARRGYRVATIKHDAHGFEIDREGKDSYRHKHAGASMTVLSSPDQIAVVKDADHDHNLSELRHLFVRDADIVLFEGYKRLNAPKIEVRRSEADVEPVCFVKNGLVAIVSDRNHDEDVPRFDLDDITGLGDFIEETFLDRASGWTISLFVDRKLIPLKLFLENLLINAVLGMIVTLKGCETPQYVEIRLLNGPKIDDSSGD